MNDRDRALLTELRQRLLQLHKTLIDWQREDYEGQYGRLQTTQLLQVILENPQFAWLRTMSGLIVSIDEALDVKSRRSLGEDMRAEAETGPLVAKARELIAPEPGSHYALRYHAALQELPEAVLAHRDLVQLLRLQRPASNA